VEKAQVEGEEVPVEGAFWIDLDSQAGGETLKPDGRAHFYVDRLTAQIQKQESQLQHFPLDQSG